ncbi:anti-sigma factor [Cryobacterium sp. TmT2-59]|uniref:anti-sigma factor domain-containing protein n=1 Tax=Cryobacterium sp. TmT2-59 TaxID=1259264 RepID=UPI00141A6CF4|nr:anti-sigma factor [Cryobacterium sp. TmT2-59]
MRLVEPGDQVWGRIHSALGLTDAVAASPRLADYASAAEPAEPAALTEPAEPAELAEPGAESEPSAAAEPAEPGARAEPSATAEPEPERAAVAEPGPTPGPDQAGQSASVTDIGAGSRSHARHRRRRVWLPVAVASGIVGLVGGIGGGIWWESLRQQAPAPVIATAELDPFPGWTASGVAQVEKTADGHREVVVDVTGATDAGLREVWLIKSDASGLISIGLLDGDSGHFAIPDGVDLSEFPLVDVSAEPDDGNPAHSGDSIVRGELRTV